MASKHKPELMDLPEKKLDQIKDRLSLGAPLPEEDIKIMLNIITAYSWLQRQLQSTKLTIYRLKKMFGFSTEKHKKINPQNEGFGPDVLTKGVPAEEALSLDKLQYVQKSPPGKK